MLTSQAPAHVRPLVLVVESDARIQRLVSQAIKDAGCTPVVAASQADADGVLDTLADQIALVILDLAKPFRMDDVRDRVRASVQAQPRALQCRRGAHASAPRTTAKAFC